MQKSIKLSVQSETWLLDRPFSINGCTSNEAEVLVVTLRSGSHRGHGEAKGVSYLGESADSMLSQILSVKDIIESGIDRIELLELLPSGGARNAIDCALWDLEVKISGKSIWELTGVNYSPITTCRTLGIEENLELLDTYAQQASDYSLLKIKLDDSDPVERVAAVRAVRPDARLIVDANQAWTFSQLVEVAPQLSDLGVEMIEQPLQRGRDAELESYASPIPLCADESCQDRTELEYVAKRYPMINIKLDKTGGLTQALLMVKEGQALGLDLMVGCMLGTSLAMAPGLVVGQSCCYADLDAPLWLKYDRKPALHYAKGEVSELDMRVWG